MWDMRAPQSEIHNMYTVNQTINLQDIIKLVADVVGEYVVCPLADVVVLRPFWKKILLAKSAKSEHVKCFNGNSPSLKQFLKQPMLPTHSGCFMYCIVLHCIFITKHFRIFF